MFLWQIWAREMISWDTLCPPEKKCPICLIWIYTILSIYFPFIPLSLTWVALVGITKSEGKTIINPKKSTTSPRHAADYSSVLYFGGYEERRWGGGAQGKMLPWRILCDRSFQFACLSLCKMWDMRDINTLPRYPCLHLSPALSHVVILW